MYNIIPGILEKDWERIEEKLNLLKGNSKIVHIDFISDPPSTFSDPVPFSKYRNDFTLEAHFIGYDPIQYIDPFYKAGFKRFVGQIEKMPNQAEFVTKGKLLGKVGLSIDGQTELKELKVGLSDLDFLLIMTVKTGASGQFFEDSYLQKVKEVRKILLEKPGTSNLTIEIDGGINEETIIKAKEAGADLFVSNSYIFNGNPKENLQKLSLLLSA
ncbi:MAG: hypothetical protein A2152_04150 [Candidatus Levybacteria bacterium RBG_16_35_6]|nr:MAG: hypothetical protein A2152_04150 [Candidatus Levybacteria bacterium RBG_16_35_6]